ncbi:hypothetical protein DSO57_1036947 [Entomophthora muscae]|uniref:Uncharacterized protein n=1 Tax=Entomophthora muscae TaxID=34485 RepID=A0ACC2TYJ7_9FUNG|nr:hypothetical protein DSO57_1036947 [Entomophthora muscae]
MQSAKLWCNSIKDRLISLIYPTPEDNEVTFDAALSSPTVTCLEESAFEANVNCKPSFDSNHKSLSIHPVQTSQVLSVKPVLESHIHYPASALAQSHTGLKTLSLTSICPSAYAQPHTGLESSSTTICPSALAQSHTGLESSSTTICPSALAQSHTGLESSSTTICPSALAQSHTGLETYSSIINPYALVQSNTGLNALSPTSAYPFYIFAPIISNSSNGLKSCFSQTTCSSATSEKQLRKRTYDSFESSSVLPESPPARKIFRFSEDVAVYETYSKKEYLRKGTKRSTFTEEEKREYKEELNFFKRHEMKVHPNSVRNTRIHYID